jgi:hypothetical protein
MGRRGQATVQLAEGARAEVVDLSGNPMPDISFKRNVLTFEPYALLGLRIHPA